MLKNIKIQSKLLVGFGSIIIITLILAGFNFVSNSNIIDSTEYTQQTYELLKTADEMVIATIQVWQWCSDISATRAQDGLNDGLENAAVNADIFYENLEKAKLLDRENAEHLESIKEKFALYHKTGIKMANAYIEGGPSVGNKIMPEFDETAETITSLIKEYFNESEVHFNNSVKDIQYLSQQANRVGIWFTSIAVLLSILTTFYITKITVQPIKTVVELTKKTNTEFNEFCDVVNTIANNNLTVRIPQSEIVNIEITSKDEIGELAQTISNTLHTKKKMELALNSMADNLSQIITKLQSNSNQLATAATEISSTSDQLSSGMKLQNQNVIEVLSAVEEMSTTIINTSKNASDAAQTSKQATDSAVSSGELVQVNLASMQQINKVVKESSESIGKLEKSAEQIGEIIGVIDDIADQTNLLALNAAIEAARAGDQGRGFAVVADEVRKLAERTGKATGEIVEMIKGIQSDTADAVNSMECGIQEVEKGNKHSDQVGISLNEVMQNNRKVMTMIELIAETAEHQSIAASQISKNVENVSNITNEVTKGAEQSALVAENLNRQALDLQNLISNFKVNA